MKTISVRRLNVSDLDDFRRVRLEGLRLHPDAFGASYEDWNKKPTQFFAERLLGDCVFGGFDLQNTLQGIIGVSCSAAPKLSHIATLWGMYVRAEMRGSGLSRALLGAALEAAKSARTIKLSVVTTNHAAKALYCSFGFTEWATDSAALFVNGVYHDECLMRRESESNS